MQVATDDDDEDSLADIVADIVAAKSDRAVQRTDTHTHARDRNTERSEEAGNCFEMAQMQVNIG